MRNKQLLQEEWRTIPKEASPTKSQGDKRRGKEDIAAKILAIIKREQDRAFWWRLNYTCGKVKGGSPTLVQVE